MHTKLQYVREKKKKVISREKLPIRLIKTKQQKQTERCGFL